MGLGRCDRFVEMRLSYCVCCIIPTSVATGFVKREATLNRTNLAGLVGIRLLAQHGPTLPMGNRFPADALPNPASIPVIHV